ncbi:MAG TPA: DUF481 domain-containing protein [Puia sp.]|nr:DUF481 domain-containing protein [Puia sp.]
MALGQINDPGAKSVRDSLYRDSVHRHMDTLKKDSVKHAADSVHYEDTTRYKYSYTGTGNFNNTNTVNSYLLSNIITFSAVKKRRAINLNTGWVYGSQQGNLTNNDFNATADINLYKTLRHFYYWGLMNYNTSLSLQINHLIQGGLGAGYNLIDKKKAALILSDGILYEKGDLYDILYGSPQGDMPQRDRYQVFRNSLRIKYHFVIHDRITLDGVELIQHSLVTIHNYILNLNASGSVRLNKWLNVTAAFAFNKFTRTRSENTLITFGVTITR